MTRLMTSLFLAAALAGGMSLLGGCSEEIAYERDVDVDDGEVTIEETRVRERPDGRLEIEEQTIERDYDEGTEESEIRRREFDPVE